MQYILFCTLPVQYLDVALGMSAISRYCTGKRGFRLSCEPSFDAKIDEAGTCAINIVGLNTFTCGIEYCLI